MTEHPFPSLYSLNPKTATIVDAKKCLEAGCNSDEIDDNGEWGAVSFFAIHSDNVPLIRYLLRMGKPKKLSSYKNNTPLLAAVRNHGIVETLIRYGVDVNETDDDGRSALWLLTSDPSAEEFILHLLRHGADINKEDNYGFTPLENAIKVDGYYFYCEYKAPYLPLQTYTKIRGEQNEESEWWVKTSVTDVLLEQGAKVRQKTLDILVTQDDDFRWCKQEGLFTFSTVDKADMTAAYERSPVKYNREHASELGEKDWEDIYDGDSFEADWVMERPDNPFWKLVFKNATVEDMKNVLDEGGDPRIPCWADACSTYFLSKSRHPETAAYLLNRCKDIDFISHEDGEGDYARILGWINHPEIVRMVADYAPYLLEETPTVTNNTLADAVCCQSVENIRLLIRLGVNVNPSFKRHFYDNDINVLGRVARSALENAIGTNNPDIVGILLKAGADVDKKRVLEELSLFYRFLVKYAELLLSTGMFSVDELLTAIQKPRDLKVLSEYETYRQTETNVEDIRTDVLDSIIIVNALKSGKSRQIVPFLKKALKGDMNHRNSNWETPLMIAVSAHIDNSKTVLKLLKAGADPTLKNNDGKTVYEMDMDPKTKECLTQFKQAKQL
ncbi:MAG: hypothetical protein J5781_04320 [Clostridia bacterium]|nr:hypothetical protein [Clostridia bacterium]